MDLGQRVTHFKLGALPVLYVGCLIQNLDILFTIFKKKTLHWNTTFLDRLLLDSPLKVPSGGFTSQRWNWALLLPGSSELTPSQASQVNTWFLLNPLVHMYKYTTVISCRNYEPSGRPGTAWPVCDIHPLTHQSLGEWVSLFRNSVFIDGSVITGLRRLWRRTLRGCGIRRVAE